jgi:hypothetical protein
VQHSRQIFLLILDGEHDALEEAVENEAFALQMTCDK